MMVREMEFDQPDMGCGIVVGMYCRRCGTAYVLCDDGYIRVGNMQTNCGVVCTANNDGSCSQIMELQGGQVVECRGRILPEMSPGNNDPELICTNP